MIEGKCVKFFIIYLIYFVFIHCDVRILASSLIKAIIHYFSILNVNPHVISFYIQLPQYKCRIFHHLHYWSHFIVRADNFRVILHKIVISQAGTAHFVNAAVVRSAKLSFFMKLYSH